MIEEISGATRVSLTKFQFREGSTNDWPEKNKTILGNKGLYCQESRWAFGALILAMTFTCFSIKFFTTRTAERVILTQFFLDFSHLTIKIRWPIFITFAYVVHIYSMQVLKATFFLLLMPWTVIPWNLLVHRAENISWILIKLSMKSQVDWLKLGLAFKLLKKLCTWPYLIKCQPLTLNGQQRYGICRA